MWLWITLGLAVIVGLIRPFGSRLQATSLWAGKALVPPEAQSAYPRGLQSALNDGWPSIVGFVTGIAPFAVAALGFLHAWWAAILAFFVTIFVTTIAERTPIVAQTVDRYLALLLEHAQRRQADFQLKGDLERADVASDLEGELEQIVSIYLGSGVPAPTMEEANNAPFGDETYLLRQHRAGDMETG